MLGLSERRARYWQARQAADALEDRRPGGRAVHALRPEEITAILALAEEWGEIDGSHRKLAHRGSYLARVWVSPASVLRVLLAHGRRLPYRLLTDIVDGDVGVIVGGDLGGERPNDQRGRGVRGWRSRAGGCVPLPRRAVIVAPAAGLSRSLRFPFPRFAR